MNNIVVIPRATEKAYRLVSGDNIYVFSVPTNANRDQIKAAIEEQFGVSVLGVKTLVQKGKAIRYIKAKRAYPGRTTRKDIKKAYVTLKEGDSIKVFDENTDSKETK